VPCQHRQAAEQAAHEQVEDGNDHSAMIPAGKPDQARSNNRAPQDMIHGLAILGATNPPQEVPRKATGMRTPVVSST
jgi:hypothetical protein